MIQKVRAYIERFRLLEPDKPVMVGLSGGADSVALLGLLVRLGYPCVALHCNFHLRGEESMRDEAFARSFAALLEVPFYQTDFDTAGYAAEHRVSIEMAARELRYVWFEELRSQLGGQAIAVAHHRDDSIETLLMNLLRGSGIRGLGGIRPKNGWVIRPLLGVSRAEILAWLEGQGYGYVTDSSNLSDAYTRNFIRLRLLPLMEQLNPSARETIARSAEHLSAAESIYLSVVEQARKQVFVADHRLSIKALQAFPAPETILYELLKPYGFSRLVVADIFNSLVRSSGKLFYSPSHRLLKDRECLCVEPLLGQEQLSGVWTVDPSSSLFHGPVTLALELVDRMDDFTLVPDRKIAYLDYDKITGPLTLRGWKQGDWFVPFGMRGRKKLSDYFSDHKFSRIEKERAWLLCAGDAIAWLVGERTDNRFRVDAATKRVLIVKIVG